MAGRRFPIDRWSSQSSGEDKQIPFFRSLVCVRRAAVRQQAAAQNDFRRRTEVDFLTRVSDQLVAHPSYTNGRKHRHKLNGPSESFRLLAAWVALRSWERPRVSCLLCAMAPRDGPLWVEIWQKGRRAVLEDEADHRADHRVARKATRKAAAEVGRKAAALEGNRRAADIVVDQGREAIARDRTTARVNRPITAKRAPSSPVAACWKCIPTDTASSAIRLATTPGK